MIISNYICASEFKSKVASKNNMTYKKKLAYLKF